MTASPVLRADLDDRVPAVLLAAWRPGGLWAAFVLATAT
jgi:hypothetical protein